MPESTKQVVKARTEAHSDVAGSLPARAHQATVTERQFGEQVLHFLREAKLDVHLRNFKEEWVETDEGVVHEISVEAQSVE